jgi:hypothetical protein
MEGVMVSLLDRLTVTLGQSLPAGYWSGESMTFTRARQDYPCQCGNPDHLIHKGDVYLTVKPDRMRSWAGDKFTHRFNIVHMDKAITVYDKKGNVIYEKS